ncbi:phosphoenolpyruvate carboxylase [Alteromonas sp. 5E99-2]|uniref:phosphoenolpyruvate carboxylase n=1 Tax=Alteromonas sp. 5E99-2 TaxID=2817683 RepID=UPI001A9A0E03|nr:phosphoenolpyruvate carboxylase [Alteromonas sp. 5E99-2]MBO1254541.1 phosphoenolpyruvate carboxylase [Alteromonas sp. 5E99-2]
MSQHYDVELKDTVRYLGRTLGETILNELGEDWLERIETIRKTGRASYQGDTQASTALTEIFSELSDDKLLTIGRAFAQFLNLGNIAEQEFNGNLDTDSALEQVFEHLADNANKKIEKQDLEKALSKLDIDLVLTAHPTEVTRRTLIHKHGQLATCLQELHKPSLSKYERNRVEYRIADLISQAWHTEEIRSVRPTPVDEAKWGFAVIENSLWEAVPDFLRELDDKLTEHFETGLPLDAAPVHFSSWMGGDRDGNPNVTAKITESVLLLSRHRAAKLFASDIEKLIVELSMRDCSESLASQVGETKEPYRELLRPLQAKLRKTRDGLAARLKKQQTDESVWLESNEELLAPLQLCYDSLSQCGMSITANGALLDTIRRVYCFGIHLLRLDVRQDSERHSDVFSEITRYLDLGDYGEWSEQDKQAFLLKELSSKRPLFPKQWNPSADVKEVLDTCKTIAKYGKEGFGIYIISMASEASDVLAVQLLLQEMGVSWPMPVAPLFETLDDLNHSPTVMKSLLSIDWYREYINDRQYVMIGYSDSAKDAGALAAGWAQYESQEALVAVAQEKDVTLTLFHGRGGTIGRGGLPAHAAIHSQPPGSLDGGFRVTEQGETIRYKFGMPSLAKRSLSIYASAILEAMVLPPPSPKQEWREKMTEMANAGRDNYRSIVRDHKDFVPYFRVATPEQELGKLPLGSRPAKRKPTGGIESLRAIPWIFAWAQTRMVLPAWLGVMKAIKTVKDNDDNGIIDDMYTNWPFFYSRLSMLDMVFHKADPRICAAYDDHLVPDSLKHFGDALREELTFSIDAHKSITGQSTIMESDPQGRESMNIRASYLEPLHYLQIELLKRSRQQDDESGQSELERAMMVTIAGIAIGMRNTG